MTALARRPWVPAQCEDFVQRLATETSGQGSDVVLAAIEAGIALNRRVHEADCVNLNPATNVMNPRAEAALASGLGSRPSLGYPGDKYEMGLEGVERIEVIAAELAAEVFGARYAEIRVPSGAIANLYAFIAAARPGDSVIVPSPAVGGHVTHHMAGCAGLYGLDIHTAPVDGDGYTVDVAGLRELALEVRPKMITIGSSLNLLPHPIREIRAIADEIGALVLFDAAHLCGMIAGHAWQQPLEEGAHLMTMSTYKSLGGPPSGLIVTNDADIAEKLDRIAFPGMTANFDAAKSAALAITLLDWRAHGRAYAAAMAGTAKALAQALAERGLPVFSTAKGHTTSHQFAVQAPEFGGGQAAAKRLRRANILTCGIGLPIAAVDGDMNGLRFGTPEIVRWGMTEKDMPELAALIARGLRGNDAPQAIAAAVSEFRRRFTKLHFVN
ncbi:MAG: aminotransferase class I/II-fold pyridoxal phosphate-dependent enzyme [Mesorhizobium sp.]|uniref:serine hydroxymethyltransferase n=2 Tax=Mesorhizobium TaxID=68287 RepID=UPI000FD5250F|nr:MULTISPECIES: aminotransferase class I/II-fold pyridoxal phosphate-dependent enzyme [unclassified Mesorhizobium]RVD44337.1 aminotransferase class I/II-fold pyridoxal phosphate-dependent enzyme [Mesorhizobium sp. M4A.F.Ca.ET.020.02.1.1]RWC18825.1 MAG: aminotransferase class I/II-fold pyridoxal phosphate-dependent enzyme [Mesorhizobium sp.]RWD01095.1 MAG: aminotransferase class I/II-fold pyridoxal phosphate-dependent enzyme [Mesorhizobium sp.]RWD25076.1 MAG: aminotransferase class I/II-fold py